MKNLQKQKDKRTNLDERQKQVNQKAMSIAWAFLVICLLGQIMYKTIKEINCFFEWNVLFASFLVVSGSRRILGNIQCPRKFIGKPLPTGSSKKDKHKRCIDYLLESLMFSSILTLVLSLGIAFRAKISGTLTMELFSFRGTYDMVNVFIIFVAAFFILVTGIGFWACYAVKEQRVKEYNRMCEELEK